MALISVPAWPMPIHHTKLVIPNPQPTGMLLPQEPIPSARVTVIASSIAARPVRAMRNARSQPLSGRAHTCARRFPVRVVLSCFPTSSG